VRAAISVPFAVGLISATFVVVGGAAAAPPTIKQGGQAGGPAAQFRIETLNAPGQVVGVHVEDLDGDGRKDVLAVVTGQAVGQAAQAGGRRERRVCVWLDEGRGAGFAGAPTQVIEPPRSAAWLDVALIDAGSKRAALLYGDDRGVFAARLVDDARGRRRFGAPSLLVEERGLLALADDDGLPFFDVARDWDGDGTTEILLPLVDGIAVWAAPPSPPSTAPADGGAAPAPDGRWARAGLLRLPPSATYFVRAELDEPRLRNFAARAVYEIPELITADYDGDGRLDLFAIHEDALTIFRGTPGPTRFSTSASARHLLGVRTPEEASRATAHVHTSVRDLDGDRVADLVIHKITGGLGQMKTQVGVYFGRRGGGYDPPAQVLQRDGYGGAASFGDVDGDGRPDLLSARVSVGLGEMARALIAKKMRVGWEVRRNHGRRFSDNADVTKDIDFPVDTSQLADVEGPYPSVAGDFDGDGKADFFSAHGSDAFGVWLGGGKKLLADAPKAIVKIVPSRHYRIVDLDGDRRSDVVVFYRRRDASAATIQVLRNTGAGW
jgi:hypothetical protein